MWNHAPFVKAWEAVALSLNMEPREVRTNPHGWMAGGYHDFMHMEGQDFEDRLEVLRRNLSSLELGDNLANPDYREVRTSSFVAWAKALGWAMPAELEGLASELPAKIEAEPPSRELSTAERNSLLKLVIGMAVRGYGYDPNALKSATATDIAADLAELGLSLDADTVRKYLREGAQLLSDRSTAGKRRKT